MNNKVVKLAGKRKNVNKYGFTLIELLVVVLIIGILAAIAVPQYQKAVAKARFAEAITNLSVIGRADAACQLSKGDQCTIDELDIDVGNDFYQTENFDYAASNSPNGTPLAKHFKEEVCLCYLETGEIVVYQDMEDHDCSSKEASMNYAQLLNLREVEIGDCSCC